jgi:hypothetical protein
VRLPSVVLAALAATLPLLSGCLDGGEPRDGDGGDVAPAAVPLGFLPPVDLVCPSDGAQYTLLDTAFGDCGKFGEPVLEVAGDGTVWASATCCVGRSPPIWVSRDGGESFQLLPFADRTGLVRDSFGIEGDFAIDDAGNAYFFDISAATTWFSKYRADGTHVHTKADVFPPVVDRPWVRAGRADEVWVFYNTAQATNLFHSTDGGLTWTVLPVGFDCALMTIGQGLDRDHLFVAGCSDDPQLRVSTDGGLTFGRPIRLPLPDLPFPPGSPTPNGTRVEVFMPPVADASGAIYVPLTQTMDRTAARRRSTSMWSTRMAASPGPSSSARAPGTRSRGAPPATRATSPSRGTPPTRTAPRPGRPCGTCRSPPRRTDSRSSRRSRPWMPIRSRCCGATSAGPSATSSRRTSGRTGGTIPSTPAAARTASW